MKRGALLFAFNSPKYNYYEMAEYTAKRIEHFLGLPVTVVTDEQSLPAKQSFKFNDAIIVEPDTTNIRDKQVWINKGRHRAYELTPYTEYIMQTAAYREALAPGAICANVFVNGTTNEVAIKIHEEQDVRNGYEMFLNLLNIFKIKNLQ